MAWTLKDTLRCYATSQMDADKPTLERRHRQSDSAFAAIAGILIGLATGIMVGWGLRCLMP